MVSRLREATKKRNQPGYGAECEDHARMLDEKHVKAQQNNRLSKNSEKQWDWQSHDPGGEEPGGSEKKSREQCPRPLSPPPDEEGKDKQWSPGDGP
jgi:hypothetical protein